MSLPVTDEQARQIAACDGTAYLVIPAVFEQTDAECNCGFGGSHDDINPRCDRNALVPDPVWVALAEATCDTCPQSSGWVPDPSYGRPGGSQVANMPCPAGCREGRPVHQLTAACEGCDGAGGTYQEHYTEPRLVWIDCFEDDCDGGRVVLGEVTVTELVPFHNGNGPDEGTCVTVGTGQGRTFWHLTIPLSPKVLPYEVDLIGDPSPGDWVAVLKVVQS